MDDDEIEVEPFHNETGEQIGWSYWNEDGHLVVVDDDGSVITAFDPVDDTIWNVARGEWTDPNQPSYGIEERLEDLEAAAYAPREPTYVPYLPEPDPEVQQIDFGRQMEHEQARMGRPFTHSEVRAIGAELTEAQAAGEDRAGV